MEPDLTECRTDFHVHTNRSDGRMDPTWVIDRAVELGLGYLSITDHDTLDGYRAAAAYLDGLANTDLKLIPGIELSTRTDGRDVHILVYYLDRLSDEFERELRETISRRTERSLEIVDELEAAGYPISRSEFIEATESINRTAIGRFLVARGALMSVGEGFDTLFGDGCPYFVPRDDMDTFHALDLASSEGGIAIIAHPALYHVVDLIEPCVRHGLRGVEAYHSEQSTAESDMLVAMAQSQGLLVTGGSDWHQDDVHPATLGSIKIPSQFLEEFLDADPR